MWFVVGDRFINMNNISSVEIVHTGVTEVEKRWMVLLRFLRNEPDQCLFQGSREECDIFMEHFKVQMLADPVFYLDAIEAAVEDVGDVR